MEAEGGGGGARGALLKMDSTGFLTKDEEPGGTTLVDACNGFKNLI